MGVVHRGVEGAGWRGASMVQEPEGCRAWEFGSDESGGEGEEGALTLTCLAAREACLKAAS